MTARVGFAPQGAYSACAGVGAELAARLSSAIFA
jgi:hypothetical protein